jgi:hypothetical protein
MRVIFVIAAALSLSGCLANMSPGERAAYDQRVREIQAQQAAEPPPRVLVQPPPQLLPTPAPAPAVMAAPTNCNTNYIGNTAYTNCQ